MLEFFINEGNEIKRIEHPLPNCWINAVRPTEAETKYLIDELGVLPEFVKSCLDPEESSHIDFDDDEGQTLIMVDYPVEERNDSYYNSESFQYATAPLGVIILKDKIVTISLNENNILDTFSHNRMRGVDTKYKTRFLLMLMLRISQNFLLYLRRIDKLSNRTEINLHKSMRNKELFQMMRLEKSLVYFSTSLKSDEITLNKIVRGKYVKMYEEDQDLFEDVMIELHQAEDMCNIYSNILSGTMDAFASIISNNLNIVMKVLTVITIVMSIPNIIFSFYGMNVEGLPFIHAWFPVAISLIACAIATYIFYKMDMFH